MVLTLASIPYSLNIGGEWCRLIHSNQLIICSNCDEAGHSRKNCPISECHNCKQLGHISFPLTGRSPGGTLVPLEGRDPKWMGWHGYYRQELLRKGNTREEKGATLTNTTSQREERRKITIIFYSTLATTVQHINPLNKIRAEAHVTECDAGKTSPPCRKRSPDQERGLRQGR